MKKLVLSTGLILLTALFAVAQTPGEAAPVAEVGAAIEFEKDVHDFGQLDKGEDAIYEFRFTNVGTEPLIISQAKKSCGCTVPTFSKEPIKPGESGVIHVKYDSNRVGPINKSVTVTSNATNSPVKVIRIKGNVKATAAAGAPVKATPSGTPTAGSGS